MRKLSREIALLILGMLFGAIPFFLIGKTVYSELDLYKMGNRKHLTLLLLMVKYCKLLQRGESISKILEKSGYKEIAVYGMSYIGEIVVEDLNNSNIVVSYGIDKRNIEKYKDVKILKPEEEQPQVDAIVVTPVTEFAQIRNVLSNKHSCAIISIEQLLDCNEGE